VFSSFLRALCVKAFPRAKAKDLTQRTQREEEKDGDDAGRNIPLDNCRCNVYCWLMERNTKRDSRATLYEHVFVTLLRTADALSRGGEALLKPYNLSGTQYNILRILRGAGEKGLACRQVGCKLISRDPDITRLLDRMESRGLIARAREKDDRRVVKARITAEGLRLLSELDEPVRELHRRQLRHLPAKQLQQLSMLLDKAREPLEAPAAED
jgi:DNA-binding MarR family transcriptional regulator